MSVKKLKLVRQLHICEQSWFRAAEHCMLYLSTKVTMPCNAFEHYQQWDLVCDTYYLIRFWLWPDGVVCHPAIGHRWFECRHEAYAQLGRAADCFHIPAEEEWPCSVWADQHHQARHHQVAPLLQHSKQVGRVGRDTNRKHHGCIESNTTLRLCY